MAGDKVTSIDKDDLQHFTNLSDVWWSQMIPLHVMNHIRIPFVQEGLLNTGQIKYGETNRREVKILDVGCGGGILVEGLAKLGYKVTGVDPGEEVIKVAKEHAKKTPDMEVNYVNTSIEEFSDKNQEKFDAVVTSEVVEHVSDPKVFLKGCVKALKPGGSIFITTINRTFWSWFFFLLLFEYILRVIPFGTHQYNKFISPLEVESILKKENCTIKKVSGWLYLPYICKWFLVPFKSVSFALHAVKM